MNRVVLSQQIQKGQQLTPKSEFSWIDHTLKAEAVRQPLAIANNTSQLPSGFTHDGCVSYDPKNSVGTLIGLTQVSS